MTRQRALFGTLLSFALLAAGHAPAARAQGIPLAQLTALKAATVYVMVQSRQGLDMGSGFLIMKDAGAGYLATNDHVVEVPPGQARRVTVVFNSGVPGSEKALRADVLAEDPHRDIAILRVAVEDAAQALAEPLKLSTPEPPHETMPVWVFGFPFGELLATSKLHPAITITTGTITSLRLDDQGKVSLVQTDADINEGNSGGPIVDSSGGLVGIATEKIEDTKVGLGLPATELADMLRGRVREVGFKLQKNSGTRVDYHVAVVLIDPLKQVKGVSVFLYPEAQVGAVAEPTNGVFGPVSPRMWEFPLQPETADFTYSGPVALQNPAHSDVVLLQQIRIQTGDGQYKWTQPQRVLVPFSQGAAA